MFKYNIYTRLKSYPSGRSAVVIVGYGYQDNKYYWIVQNFSGKAICDKG